MNENIQITQKKGDNLEVITITKPISDKDMIELEVLINKIVYEEAHEIPKIGTEQFEKIKVILRQEMGVSFFLDHTQKAIQKRKVQNVKIQEDSIPEVSELLQYVLTLISSESKFDSEQFYTTLKILNKLVKHDKNQKLKKLNQLQYLSENFYYPPEIFKKFENWENLFQYILNKKLVE
jgi:hypothetical protein